MPFEHYIQSGGKRLRCGYTTGTCAALAAAGAARLLLGGRAPESVTLTTPGGLPLAADSESLRALAACMVRRFGQPEGGALVLLGHGTEHFANMVYPAMQTALRLAGGRRAYMGTVEGWPGFDEVLAQLKEDGCGQALLVPFMLVAGDHALNDMAGDGPKSWKSRLEAAGVGVRCRMRGLGALPEVQALYGARLREIV